MSKRRVRSPNTNTVLAGIITALLVVFVTLFVLLCILTQGAALLGMMLLCSVVFAGIVIYWVFCKVRDRLNGVSYHYDL